MQERKKANLDTRVLCDATVLHVNPFKCQKWVFFYYQNSATYWEGNCEAESLQRLYGISFPNEKQVNYLLINIFFQILVLTDQRK